MTTISKGKEVRYMTKEAKDLMKQLEKCKDRSSKEARAIRRKLRAAGEYIRGKQEAKKAKKENTKKHKKVEDDEDDEQD